MTAARIDRGWLSGSRAERMPRSSTRQRTRHAVSVSSSCQVLSGTRPATTSSALRSRITSPIRSRCGTSSDRSPGSRAISRKPRNEPSSGRVPGQPRRQTQQRQVERGVDVEPRPRRAAEVSPGEARLVEMSCRRVVRLAPREDVQRALEVTGHHECIGAEAVVGDDLAGDRREQVVERVIGHEAERPASGVADRVERTIARRERAPRGVHEPAAPVKCLARTGLDRGKGSDRRTETSEAMREVGRQESLPVGGDCGVRAERPPLGRGRDEDERRGSLRHRRRRCRSPAARGAARGA